MQSLKREVCALCYYAKTVQSRPHDVQQEALTMTPYCHWNLPLLLKEQPFSSANVTLTWNMIGIC